MRNTTNLVSGIGAGRAADKDGAITLLLFINLLILTCADNTLARSHNSNVYSNNFIFLKSIHMRIVHSAMPLQTTKSL
jgi:hypothetical protein